MYLIMKFSPILESRLIIMRRTSMQSVFIWICLIVLLNNVVGLFSYYGGALTEQECRDCK